jgi:hypothetical protein
MRDELSKFANPVERDRMKRELMRDLRRLRRPFYYARETERRRELATARRKVMRRTTSAPMPTPEEILAAWNARKESREAMVRLGGMLQDLECYVDNCLRFGEDGEVVGRNGGIRGWLFDKLPELLPKYKTLMRYKAMADKFRRVCGLGDPDGAEDALAPSILDVSAISDFRSQISGFPPTPAAMLAAARERGRELLAEHRTAKALDDALWAALGLVRTRRRPAAA